MRDLEQEVGATLFERTNGGTWLTPAGQEFLEAARRIYEPAERRHQAEQVVPIPDSSPTERTSVARYGRPRKKRRVGGESAGHELGEEPHALRLACLALSEKPNRSIQV